MNKKSIEALAEKLKTDKKTLLILILAIFGMLFIMVSRDAPSDEVPASDEDYMKQSVYESASELEDFIENLEGAGKTKVMLTFDSFGESIFAKDEDSSVDERGRSDESRHIIIDNGSSDGGLEIKTLAPEIRGVAVLCVGGENPVVKEQIISLVSALFDIGTNKISVAPMAE